MKNIIGITVIIVFSFMAIWFLIAAWWQGRKNKNEKNVFEEMWVDNEIDYSLDYFAHFDYKPEQVN